MGASSSRSGMKRRSMLSGSRNRNVPASNCAHSSPNAFADMQRTSTRECWSPSSTSPSLHHTRIPSARSRFARARTTALSMALWLRNTSKEKCSGIFGNLRPLVRGVAQRIEIALLAFGSARHAPRASVQNYLVREEDPPLLGHDLDEILLDLHGVGMLRQTQPLRDPR